MSEGGATEERLQRIEQRVDELASHMQRMSDSVAELASIEKDIRWIREHLGATDRRIEALEERARSLETGQARQGVVLSGGQAAVYAALLSGLGALATYLIAAGGAV